VARIRRAVLQKRRVPILREQLESLVLQSPGNVRDPIQLVKRYSDPADIEVAAVFASVLAFGRLEAFMPVIEAVLELADHSGGPARWVAEFDAGSQAALRPMLYRWIRGTDLILLARTLGQLRRANGSLYAVVSQGHDDDHPDLGPALDHLITQIRQTAVDIAGALSFSDLSRGFRHALPRPSSGSGCKRWNMLLRWMIRVPTHPNDPDLGLWDLPAHKLVIPVDTHVLRVAKLIGLTHRTDGSWRTAQEITANLRKIDPNDPVRYDFALAHLGISGGCRSRHIAEICAACPLSQCCRHGRVRTEP
jgi:uncharacterized protein (TIGR02757 family)